MSRLKVYLIVLLLPLISGCATIDEYLFDAHPDGTPIGHERTADTVVASPAQATPDADANEQAMREEEARREAAARAQKEEERKAAQMQGQLWVRVTFKSGRTGLAENARRALSKAAGKFLSQGTGQSIAVRGYCDDEPIGGYDGKRKSAHRHDSQLALSKARADSVRDILVKAGIAADKVTATGFGATDFIADNATVEGRNKNRRVDIFLLDN